MARELFKYLEGCHAGEGTEHTPVCSVGTLGRKQSRRTRVGELQVVAHVK